VADLVRYRISKEMLVRRVVESDLPTVYGKFRAVAYENVINGDVHLAMVMGNVRTTDPVLVRVHTENVTAIVWIADRRHGIPAAHCPGRKIAAAGQGVVLYYGQREHSLDLVHQLRTYALMQERGLRKRDASVETAMA